MIGCELFLVVVSLSFCCGRRRGKARRGSAAPLLPFADRTSRTCLDRKVPCKFPLNKRNYSHRRRRASIYFHHLSFTAKVAKDRRQRTPFQPLWVRSGSLPCTDQLAGYPKLEAHRDRQKHTCGIAPRYFDVGKDFMASRAVSILHARPCPRHRWCASGPAGPGRSR